MVQARSAATSHPLLGDPETIAAIGGLSAAAGNARTDVDYRQTPAVAAQLGSDPRLADLASVAPMSRWSDDGHSEPADRPTALNSVAPAASDARVGFTDNLTMGLICEMILSCVGGEDHGAQSLDPIHKDLDEKSDGKFACRPRTSATTLDSLREPKSAWEARGAALGRRSRRASVGASPHSKKST